jgi:dihydroorotate dehydrogenase (NAD+) catalytic subunit
MPELLGKKVRGRFGYPSGVIATNEDTARWMLAHVPQLGFFVGKSTTIEPRKGNPEDILAQPTPDSLWNAVGYANPGLEATVEGFRELRDSAPRDVFLMPQIGESNEERFAHALAEFDRAGDLADGYELNVSCPHADKGGILIGSEPEALRGIVAASRRATKKPLVVKLNAGVDRLEEIARAAADAGADALSVINTLGGPNPELSKGFGGLSGAAIFPITLETVRRLRKAVSLPMIAMGGIRGAGEIRQLERIDDSLFYAIGTALGGLRSDQCQQYFRQLEQDLGAGTDEATRMTLDRMLMEYRPFVVSEVEEYGEQVRLIRFRETLDAGIGQFVFLKLDHSHAKPFSLGGNRNGLELLIRKVGPMTAKSFELKVNDVVRVRGPYGRKMSLPEDRLVIFVGAGVGTAPVHFAAQCHPGPKRFVIGTVTASELAYVDALREMGEVSISTDDGTAGRCGLVTELLEEVLEKEQPENPCFFNCGPEVAMRAAEMIERNYTSPENIHHLVERMTGCAIGICGKCSIPSGERACVDGPAFAATRFTPNEYMRDKTGKKVTFSRGRPGIQRPTRIRTH